MSLLLLERPSAAPEPSAWQPVDVRGVLPARHADRTENGYQERWGGLAVIDGIDYHYTASSPGAGLDLVKIIAAIQIERVAAPDGTKFPALAYTYIVDSAGTVYMAHDLVIRTWHNAAPGHNTTRASVCFIGDGEPNAKQIEGMRLATLHIAKQLPAGQLQHYAGHGDSFATACPGPNRAAWIAEVTR